MAKTNKKDSTDSIMAIAGAKMNVRLSFFEGVLGTLSGDPEIHRTYIASKSEDAAKIEEEVNNLGVDAVEEKQMTIFPKTDDNIPFLYDYQIRGFFKGACGFMRSVPKSLSSKIKAYKKKIDGHVMIKERIIPFQFDGEIGKCERPLRASTPQGERIALAASEEIPEGATIDFTVDCLIADDLDLVREWLNYGRYNGIGQWRNSGKGRFVWYELSDDGEVIGGNASEYYSA